MKRKGFTLVELLVVIAIIALLMSILMPALSRVREMANRTVCGSNARGIVNSMHVYANENDQKFPVAGASGAAVEWGQTPAFGDPDPTVAFGTSGGGTGVASVTASLFLLVRYDYCSTKQFLCKSDPIATEPFRHANLSRIWDFGDDPTSHVSFGYHQPYATFPLTPASEPTMAAVADRNPHLDSTATLDDPDYPAGFQWGEEYPREQRQLWNSESHGKDGQNVAYLDAHVEFEEFSFCGYEEDNIYTIATGTYDQNPDYRLMGEPPVFKPATVPYDRVDSLVLNQPN